MSGAAIRLLGPLEVEIDGRRVDVRRRKQRALLALLALRAGEVVSTDRLVDELWGASPPKAAVGSLQNVVSELRKQLSSELILTRAPGYVLDVTRDAVDAHRFERLAREARAAPAADRVALLRDALALWRGPALADADLDGRTAEAARLEELRLAAWEDRIEAELELGGHAQAIGELESLAVKHSLRERPIRLLMLALYRAGRQVDALETYRRFRETLVEELGIDPSAELQRLERAILRHDENLDLPEPPMRRALPTGGGRRKTVTIVFVDVVGSTDLAASLDPEVFRGVMTRYFDLVREAVKRHGGVVEKFIGDAAMAAFGVPTLHEDDALRAVRCAAQIRESLAPLNLVLADEHGIALQIRIGVNTGEVLAGDPSSGEAFLTGAPVIQATRLQQVALPGEILLGDSTYRLVRHAVEADPAEVEPPAFRLADIADASRPLGSAPLVGRGEELAWLQAMFAGVQAERRSRVVTVFGEAGVGKSRLTAEFVHGLRGARALVGRCVSYGEGATFLPLASIVREAVPERPRATIAALLEGDPQAAVIAERVTQLVGETDGAPSTGEVFWAIRRFLEGLARERPLVVVLEDVHWAQPTLLDLVDYLGAWAVGEPLLVLCLARRELREERPGWGATGTLTLEPLADEDAAALVAEAAAGALDDDARGRIVALAEGNPLFLEQLVAFVTELGAEALASVPPSVEAVLAGRLERLEPEERAVLERAAVVGRDFSRGALLALTPPEELAGLDTRLSSLVRRGFVGALRDDGRDAYRFHHVLVRDVAYASVTKLARADLHERYGRWLEQREGPGEIVGYHLEQAYRFGAEVRPATPGLGELAERAGTHLADAGLRAFRRADGPAATNLLDRAARLLPRGDPRRALALCELGFAHRFVGDPVAGETTLLDAIGEAAEADDRVLEARARIELAHLRLFGGGAPDELTGLIAEAMPLFEAAGDDRALGRAWRTLGYVSGSLGGRCEQWLASAERASDHYRRSGWSTAGCLSEAAAALYYGPVPVAAATEHCDRLLKSATDQLGSAYVIVYAAGLAGLTERYEDAFAKLDDADRVFRELGEHYALSNNSGRIRAQLHFLARDLEAAEQELRRCCDAFRAARDGAALATAAAELGQVLYDRGELARAAAACKRAAAAAPPADIVSQFSWRSLRAKLLVAEGRSAEAAAVGRAAVALAEQTDVLTSRGHVLVDLAIVLKAAGSGGDAAATLGAALSLYAQKGDSASERRARGLLEPAVSG